MIIWYPDIHKKWILLKPQGTQSICFARKNGDERDTIDTMNINSSWQIGYYWEWSNSNNRAKPIFAVSTKTFLKQIRNEPEWAPAGNLQQMPIFYVNPQSDCKLMNMYSEQTHRKVCNETRKDSWWVELELVPTISPAVLWCQLFHKRGI